MATYFAAETPTVTVAGTEDRQHIHGTESIHSTEQLVVAITDSGPDRVGRDAVETGEQRRHELCFGTEQRLSEDQ